MKTLTLWQPWAGAIAAGLKKYETRGWPTKHRGLLAIHASLRPMDAGGKTLIPLHFSEGVPEPGAPTQSQIARGGHGEGGVVAARKARGIIKTTTPSVLLAQNCHPFAKAKGNFFETYGKIICVCELQDCIFMTPEFIAAQTETERAFGDWRPGRYAWKLGNVRVLPDPIPTRGYQGLWSYDMPDYDLRLF
ncbi:MAG: ASCH domain-containing protein [Proteobacteria bacterium]|nr:ASCH domain-containing protein [Pseudomonadota bacterium]